MMHLRISITCIVAIALLFYGSKIVNSSLRAGHAGRIDSFMNAVYRRGQFTGAILVASHDRIIYEKAFGFADRKRQHHLPWIPANTSGRYPNR